MSNDEKTPVETPRKRRKTDEQEALRLRAEWGELERERERLQRREDALMKQWPEDLTNPHGVPIKPGIDWDAQPSIPAEKIDWSSQGQPLRVKPTLGSMITVIAILGSIIGGGAYFYWGVRLHVASKQLHVPPSGIPWGVPTMFESRQEATKARVKLREDIASTVRQSNDKLRTDILQAIDQRHPKRRHRSRSR